MMNLWSLFAQGSARELISRGFHMFAFYGHQKDLAPMGASEANKK